jgi:uncharacterized membrane protein
MKTKELHCILLAVFLVIISSIPASEAISLGVMQKTTQAQVEPGQTAEFLLVFWNPEDEYIEVSTEIENVPGGWTVVSKPRQISVGKSEVKTDDYGGGNYIRRTDGKGYIETEELRIFVKVPEDAKGGQYNIILKVLAGKPTKGITIYQQRDFELKVNVRKPTIIDRVDESPNPVAENIEAIGQEISGRVITPNVPTPVTVVFSVIILFVIGLAVFKRVVK